MEIPGHVENGVVVLEGGASLPEGAAVTVTLRKALVIRAARDQRQVRLPLVPSAQPGSIDLTNEKIAELLDEIRLPHGRTCAGPDHP